MSYVARVLLFLLIVLSYEQFFDKNMELKEKLENLSVWEDTKNLYNIYETVQKPIADKFLYIKLPVCTLPVSLSSFKSVENIYNASDSAARAAIKINLCSKFVHSCETIRAIFQSPNVKMPILAASFPFVKIGYCFAYSLPNCACCCDSTLRAALL